MNRKYFYLVVAFVATSVAGNLSGAEEQYPLPTAYSQSWIMGKKLRNPFAAKLRISQSRLRDLVADSPEAEVSGLLESLTLRTTMYFGKGSKHNRAIINGRVQRPGDVLILPGEIELTATVDEIRPNEVTLVHREPDTGRTASLTLKTAG